MVFEVIFNQDEKIHLLSTQKLIVEIRKKHSEKMKKNKIL